MLKIVVHTLDKFGHGGYNEAVNQAGPVLFWAKKLLFSREKQQGRLAVLPGPTLPQGGGQAQVRL